MPTYDKHYQESNYFGEPYPELLSFFSNHKPKGRVLDLGCGQGRDSIALARMGYMVTGVDISKVGISQIMSVAADEDLNIDGIVGSIYQHPVEASVDIVLLDSMLHFYKRDEEKESAFLRRIMEELRVNGLLCVVVWKSEKIEKQLMKIMGTEPKWITLFDNYIEYPDMNMEMRMIVQRKTC